MHECMKDEEKEGLERLTKKLKLGVGLKWKGKMIFLEKKGLGLREKREILRYLR